MIQSEKHQKALDQFLEKVKKDKTVIACILAGSMARGEHWEESDIDIALVVDTNVEKERMICYENDILFDIFIFTRSEFIKLVNEGYQADNSGNSFYNIILSTSQLLFCHDSIIDETLRETGKLRKKNQQILLLKFYDHVDHFLIKTRKTIDAGKISTTAFII